MHPKKERDDSHWQLMARCGTHWHGPDPRDLLIGIDDTDNHESPGTGFRAREIARLISDRSLGEPQGITRHQLLFDPRIPYTSHNSSACICVRGVTDESAIVRLCRSYLLEHSAPGSDAGLCVQRREAVPDRVRRWGRLAKTEVLTLLDAQALAIEQDVLLDGLTGNRGGMIGALAAVGLHSEGQDGRFLWVKGLREAANRTLAVSELTGVLHVLPLSQDGRTTPAVGDRVALGEWPRAVMAGHAPTLLLEKEDEDDRHEWRVVPRELIKRF